MKKKLRSILLIDDDEATNFVNEMVIEEADVTDNIITKTSGQAALDFLENANQSLRPNIIFLDINMPAMNGWEFLVHYKQLSKDVQGDIVVIMLSTSLNHDDAEKASDNPLINEFQNKPLSTDKINFLVQKHFPSYL